MRDLHYKNIVDFIEVIEDKKIRNIVMEYVSGGSLLHLKMDEAKARLIFWQIIDGLVYMHKEKKVAHR